MTLLFQKHDAGTLTLQDFWRLHNEHRPCFPRFVLYYLAFATRWNSVAEMWVTQAMLLGGAAMLLSVFWRECRSAYRAWLFVPVAFIAMGLRQGENMLDGWEVTFVMTAISSVATIYFLYLMNRPRLRAVKFAAAIAAGTVAAFSGSHGLLVWIAGLLPLELLPVERRRKTVLFLSWLFIGAVVWFVYFWGYQKPAVHPAVGFSLQYGLTYVGAGLFPGLLLLVPGEGVQPVPLTTMIVGAIVIVLALASSVLSFRHRKASESSFWLGLIVYSLLVAAATTTGRAGFGPGQALSSRYATFSELAVIGLYGTLTCLAIAGCGRFAAILWGCLFGLIVSGLVLLTVEGFGAGAKKEFSKDYHAFVLSTIDTQPDEVARAANESADPIREGVVLLKKHGWNVYAPGGTAAHYCAALCDAARPGEAGTSRAESIRSRQGRKVPDSRRMATNTEGSDAVGGVYLDIDGTLYPTFYGMPSPGLGNWMANERAKRDEQAAGSTGKAAAAQPQANDRLDYCGFQRAFATGLFAKGHHRLTVKVLTKDRSSFFASPPPAEFTVE